MTSPNYITYYLKLYHGLITKQSKASAIIRKKTFVFGKGFRIGGRIINPKSECCAECHSFVEWVHDLNVEMVGFSGELIAQSCDHWQKSLACVLEK